MNRALYVLVLVFILLSGCTSPTPTSPASPAPALEPSSAPSSSNNTHQPTSTPSPNPTPSPEPGMLNVEVKLTERCSEKLGQQQVQPVDANKDGLIDMHDFEILVSKMEESNNKTMQLLIKAGYQVDVKTGAVTGISLSATDDQKREIAEALKETGELDKQMCATFLYLHREDK